MCVVFVLFCFLPKFSLLDGDVILPYPKSRLCLLVQIHIPWPSHKSISFSVTDYIP